ncbi:MAG: MerR family transcriptional regulator [Planctomycetota bacterium]
MKNAYTTGEAARICGLSLSTIKRWIKRGALRVYRTPGGDIRIPPDQLRDFMREYDIPLHRLEQEEPRVLLATADRRCRGHLVASIEEQFPVCRVQVAAGEMDLGFQLGAFRPWVVVLDADADAAESLAGCARIRRFLAPEPVRIGMCIAAGQAVPGATEADRPDILLAADADREEIDVFVWNLIEGVATSLRQPDGAEEKRSA